MIVMGWTGTKHRGIVLANNCGSDTVCWYFLLTCFKKRQQVLFSSTFALRSGTQYFMIRRVLQFHLISSGSLFIRYTRKREWYHRYLWPLDSEIMQCLMGSRPCWIPNLGQVFCKMETSCSGARIRSHARLTCPANLIAKQNKWVRLLNTGNSNYSEVSDEYCVSTSKGSTRLQLSQLTLRNLLSLLWILR
jgi:hypothetical protein